MAETFDQPFKMRVLYALTDALKEITPANGYAVDLSDTVGAEGQPVPRVFRGRSWFGDEDPLPMISVLEAASPADDVAELPIETSSGEYDWALMVQGFITDDPVNPTDPAYVLLADVRRRLAQARLQRSVSDNTDSDILGQGHRITKLTIGPGVVRPVDDVSATSYFWLIIVLRIIDNAMTPYA